MTSSSFKLLSVAEILQAHDVVDDVKTECRMAYSLVPGSSVGYTDLESYARNGRGHTPSIAFRHFPPNSAGFSYATERALFISAQLSSDAVSALRKLRVLI